MVKLSNKKIAWIKRKQDFFLQHFYFGSDQCPSLCYNIVVWRILMNTNLLKARHIRWCQGYVWNCADDKTANIWITCSRNVTNELLFQQNWCSCFLKGLVTLWLIFYHILPHLKISTVNVRKLSITIVKQEHAGSIISWKESSSFIFEGRKRK